LKEIGRILLTVVGHTAHRC